MPFSFGRNWVFFGGETRKGKFKFTLSSLNLQTLLRSHSFFSGIKWLLAPKLSLSDLYGALRQVLRFDLSYAHLAARHKRPPGFFAGLNLMHLQLLLRLHSSVIMPTLNHSSVWRPYICLIPLIFLGKILLLPCYRAGGLCRRLIKAASSDTRLNWLL